VGVGIELVSELLGFSRCSSCDGDQCAAGAFVECRTGFLGAHVSEADYSPSNGGFVAVVAIAAGGSIVIGIVVIVE